MKFNKYQNCMSDEWETLVQTTGGYQGMIKLVSMPILMFVRFGRLLFQHFFFILFFVYFYLFIFFLFIFYFSIYLFIYLFYFFFPLVQVTA